MKQIGLADIDILDVGNAIALCGAIYTGNGNLYLVPFPSTGPEEFEQPFVMLTMSDSEMERFLNQSDVLDVRAPNKAILRKSQRNIDRNVQWKVFERDGYRCRYCGKRAPLTVDHVILWENGGATVEDNLLAACGKCNRLRGNMEYAEWLNSSKYKKIAPGLSEAIRIENLLVVKTLETLKAIQVKERSR